MNLLRKFSTAINIIRNEGLLAFYQTLQRNVATFIAPYSPDESAIAYDALVANTVLGQMIDVGAHSGSSLSPFAQSGWHILAFEPDSENRKKLVATYGNLPNVVIDSRAVSNEQKQNVVFYRSEESTGISGLSSFHSSHQPVEEVDVTTLDQVLTEQRDTEIDIDFLKIDTEGFDLFVLKGFPWKRTAPRLILCEFEDSKTTPLGYNFHDLARYLVQHGYQLIISEWYPIKKYGSNHTWRRFTQYPCELEDINAWGNILATRENSLYKNLLQLCKL